MRTVNIESFIGWSKRSGTLLYLSIAFVSVVFVTVACLSRISVLDTPLSEIEGCNGHQRKDWGPWNLW